MDELWQQAFDDTHEGGTISHRFAALLFAEPSPVQGPVATKLETQQFNCFHVSAEDFQRLKALPVGAKLYTAAPTVQEPVHPDSARIDWLTNNPLDALDIFGHVKGSDAVRWIRQEIDNAILARGEA
jgi:hypothetical protein